MPGASLFFRESRAFSRSAAARGIVLRQAVAIVLSGALLVGLSVPTAAFGQARERINARFAVGLQQARLFARAGTPNTRASEQGELSVQFGVGIVLADDLDLDLDSRVGSGGNLDVFMGTVGFVVRPFPSARHLYVRAGAGYMSATLSVDCAIPTRPEGSSLDSSVRPGVSRPLTAHVSCSGPNRSSNPGLDFSFGAAVPVGPHVALGPVLWFARSLGGTGVTDHRRRYPNRFPIDARGESAAPAYFSIFSEIGSLAGKVS